MNPITSTLRIGTRSAEDTSERHKWHENVHASAATPQTSHHERSAHAVRPTRGVPPDTALCQPWAYHPEVSSANTGSISQVENRGWQRCFAITWMIAWDELSQSLTAAMHCLQRDVRLPHPSLAQRMCGMGTPRCPFTQSADCHSRTGVTLAQNSLIAKLG